HYAFLLSCSRFFFLMTQRPLMSTLFPYTTLFRSLENASRDRPDVGFDLPHALRVLHLVGREAGGPAIEPVTHHLLSEREFPFGGGIAAQVAPDHLRLVEHRVFDVRVGARARNALAQRLQRGAFERLRQ